jgi:glycine oxidase
MPPLPIIIAGGGVVGLSLALELRQLRKEVIVLERDHCGDTSNGSASPASAGMLGVYDPNLPPQLRALAEFSYSLYPEFLARIEQLSGRQVPVGPTEVLEALNPEEVRGREPLLAADLLKMEPEMLPGKSVWYLREEPCLDPRLLCAALLSACRAAGVEVRENEPVIDFLPSLAGMSVRTKYGSYQCDLLALASGAWTAQLTGDAIAVEPRRGQMLVLQSPQHPIRHSIRGPECYLVPRADGRVLVGSTVERTGFDSSVSPSVMERLHAAAAQLFPSLAASQRLEQWAGLRPGTPDDLPILGALRQEAAFPSRPRVFAATGHFRNGIMLAPGTARVMAQVLDGRTPTLPLYDFSPSRFSFR